MRVEYWACCREEHAEAGIHYHCCLKLSGSKKWISVKKYLAEQHGIQVHFSATHNFYLSAYRYVCKSDTQVYHSENHPRDLINKNSPATKNCISASQASAKRKSLDKPVPVSQHKARKTLYKKLTNLDASEIIRKESATTYVQLLALAKIRQDSGQTDLINYVLSKTEKQLRELIQKTTEMQTAESKVQTQSLTRMDIMRSFCDTPCEEPCDGEWLNCAKTVLRLNGIDENEYATAIRQLLSQGRGKHRNVIIVGPSNAGKTFMLKPLQTVFKGYIFQNPETTNIVG